MNDTDIFKEIVALQELGKAAALATVIDSSGSAPRKAGAKMLVLADGSVRGSIGGGRVELETIEAARDVLAVAGSSRTLSFVLTEEYGHVCGGCVTIFIESVATAPRLIIIGAGHVGKALARVASFAGFRVMVADERPACADVSLPGVAESFTGDACSALEHFTVNDSTFIVIATSGFETDFDAARAALKTAASYIGIIGSRRKKEVLQQTLFEEGYPATDLRRLTIPTGVPIGAETAEEIAISIVGQLIETRRNHAATRAGDTPGSREVAPDGTLQTVVAAG